MRKKYENYKKLFITEKTEKDIKIKEISLLKEQSNGPVAEVKELIAKCENLKIRHQTEYSLRKEKEQKLDTAMAEI